MLYSLDATTVQILLLKIVYLLVRDSADRASKSLVKILSGSLWVQSSKQRSTVKRISKSLVQEVGRLVFLVPS